MNRKKITTTISDVKVAGNVVQASIHFHIKNSSLSFTAPVTVPVTDSFEAMEIWAASVFQKKCIEVADLLEAEYPLNDK